MHRTMNLDRLAEISLGDLELRNHLIRLFLADAPKQLEAMDAAIRAGDPEAWSAASHRLRGGCGNLGLERASEACAQAERRGPEASPDTLEELLSAVREALEAGIAELRALQGEESETSAGESACKF